MIQFPINNFKFENHMVTIVLFTPPIVAKKYTKFYWLKIAYYYCERLSLYAKFPTFSKRCFMPKLIFAIEFIEWGGESLWWLGCILLEF